jgi:phosphotransferase system HPr-like phosphotransfer protein
LSAARIGSLATPRRNQRKVRAKSSQVRNATLSLFRLAIKQKRLVELGLKAKGSDGRSAMKMIAEYLENALRFEGLAADEPNPKLKADFEKQAAAYRKLAAERAGKLGLSPPSTILDSRD